MTISMTESAPHVAAGADEFPPLTRGQVGYTAVVALLAWTFAVYDLITFGNLLPLI